VPLEDGPDCWGGDYEYYVECQMAGPAADEYYYWDSYYYYDDWSYDGDWEEWYYYGDDWSIYAAQGDDTTMMAAAFQDFFYWAIIGESDEAGDCMATCGEMETMCCAGVTLKQGDSYFTEAHCMNQQVVEENYVTQLGDMDVELVCKDNEPYRGDGAKFLAIGASILSLLAMAV